MLDLPRYLLGVVEVLLLAGFATLGATAVRSRLLPGFAGAPAHLATAVLALALLVWTGELLGAVGLFEPLPYFVGVAAAGIGTWALGRGSCRPGVWRTARHPDATRGRGVDVASLVALAIALVAVIKFGLDVKPKLSTGMTGFDSTWYHGPFAAGFAQSGDTWGLHFIAPQFLAWFYPANAELFHGVGMLAFDRDLLSPLLNLGWFIGCLVACWCIGRPFGVAPWSLMLGAVALSLPVLSDQAGEARNDIVGIFLLLAAVAIAVNAWGERASSGARSGPGQADGERGLQAGALLVTGLAAGLAAGTKLNFLLPAAVLVLGLALIAPRGGRGRALGIGGLAAFAGGGYWYLRNLIHSGNPLPWFTDLGPISLPGPDQALGGREGHSVLGYLTDGPVWSGWLLPGLRDGLTVLWPLLLALALAGLLLSLGRGANAPLRLVGAVGLAAALAWLIAPTSASGPEGIPRGFESGLRYLAPALVLGFALLPAGLSVRLRGAGMGRPSNGRILKMPVLLDRHLSGRGAPHAGLTLLCLMTVAAVAIGYPVQRHYLESRYTSPSFAEGGLNAAFAWARDVDDARIATTTTRQYPLFGTDLSNHIQFIGESQPQGGFTAPTTCPQWRRLLNEGNYDYVVASKDRIEPNKPPYPPSAAWTEGPGSKVLLREPPTVVFRLTAQLDPSACR